MHVQSIVRFNTYIGLALVAALYHKEGMAILAILLAVSIPVVNVISVLSLTSSENMALKPVLLALLKNPLIVSCLFGGVFNALQIPLWDGILNLLKLFSSSSLPLGLLCVGAALQFMEMKRCARLATRYRCAFAYHACAGLWGVYVDGFIDA